MGNGSAAQTNKLLDQNRQNAYDVSNTEKQYAGQDRSYQTGVRDYATDAYKDLYSKAGAGFNSGGGGYSPVALPALRDNEALGTYRDFMNNGGYNDQQIQDFRGRANATIPSFFAGIKQQMDQAANVRGGGYAGYSGQLAKSAREGAQSAEAGRLNAEGTLQDQIRQNKLTGAGHVETLDRESMAAANARAQQENQNRAAAASRSSANTEQAFRDQMAVLNEMRSLRGEGGTDLAYLNAAAGNNGQAQSAITSRVAEKSPLDIGMGVIGGLASAASAFTPMGAAGGIAKKLLGGNKTSAGIPSPTDWSNWAHS